MTDQHPITPPPELVQQWLEEADTFRFLVKQVHQHVAERAAQWSYDQRGDVNDANLQQARDEELEACIAWFDKHIPGYELVADRLRAARRPKPPSLKEQALAELTAWTEMRNGPGESLLCDGLSVATIRRALEALSND